jgi:hypothetical protein
MVHFLEQGESASNAIKKTFQALPDYSDPGRFPERLAFLRKGFPMIGWTYRMATEVPKLTLQNPKLATYPLHAVQAMEQENANPAPDYLRERGMSFELPNQQPGEKLRAGVRTPVTDIASIPMDPMEFLGSSHPLARMAIEAGTGKQIGDGRDKERAFTGKGWERNWGLTHQGATGNPHLESSEGVGAFSDWADMALGDAPIWAINKWNMMQGRQPLLGPAPGSSQDPSKAADLRMLNAQTGFGLVPTSPGTESKELTWDPKTKRAAGTKKRMKDLKKKDKR